MIPACSVRTTIDTHQRRDIAYVGREDKAPSRADQSVSPQVSRLSTLRLSNPVNCRSRLEVPIDRLPGRCSSSKA